MADDAMSFLVDEGAGATLRPAGTAVTVALAVASVTPTGGTAGLLPDVLAGIALRGSLLSKSGAPVTADLGDGQYAICVDTSTTPPTFRLTARQAGALYAFTLNPSEF